MVIGSEGFLGDPAKSRGGEEGEQTTSLCSWGERKEREEGERGGERGRRERKEREVEREEGVRVRMSNNPKNKST